jgi:hypothetical protein
MLGFVTFKDTLEVLLVPLSVALLAVLWPAIAERRRRSNFEALIGRELEEAAPFSRDAGLPWHGHLSRRFLHEEIIGHPGDNTEFILSLKPELLYNLSQMWISFEKAKSATDETPSSISHAEQFCWHLKQVATYLDQKSGSSLVDKVWMPWTDRIREKHPGAKIDD